MLEATSAATFAGSALELAAEGLPVFPLKPDKSPLSTRGHHDATTSEQRIRAWLNQHPDALIGVPAGTDAWPIDVLDVDSKLKLTDIIARDGAPLLSEHDAYMASSQQTPRGYHVFFQRGLGESNTAGRLAEGVDTRAGGKGYIVVYDAAALLLAADLAPEVPARLLELLTEPRAPEAETSAAPGQYGATDPGASQLLSDAFNALRNAPEGTRNDALNKAAFEIGNLAAVPRVHSEIALALLAQLAREVGLNEAEIRKTIPSSYEAGKLNNKRPERPYEGAKPPPPVARSVSADVDQSVARGMLSQYNLAILRVERRRQAKKPFRIVAHKPDHPDHSEPVAGPELEACPEEHFNYVTAGEEWKERLPFKRLAGNYLGAKIPTMKQAAWDSFEMALTDLIVDVDMGKGASPLGFIRYAVEIFRADAQPESFKSLMFTDDGYVYLEPDGIIVLRQRFGLRDIARGELREQLSLAGFKPAQYNGQEFWRLNESAWSEGKESGNGN